MYVVGDGHSDTVSSFAPQPKLSRFLPTLPNFSRHSFAFPQRVVGGIY